MEASQDEAPILGEQDAAPQPLQRARHVFDPWLRTDRKIIEALGGNVGSALYYGHAGPRVRAPKQRDMEAVIRVSTALFTNLAFALSLDPTDPSVAVSLGASKRKLTRYDAPGFSFVPRIVEALSAYGEGVSTFTLQKSSQRGIASIIRPGVQLFSPLTDRSPTEKWFRAEDFYQDLGGETVILTRTDRDFVQDTRTRERIDYREDDASPTHRFREEVRRINTYLAAAKMGMEPDGGPPVATGCRKLFRFFSLLEGDSDDAPRFDQGGRLFGGWWQSLAKSRRASIRLEGEPIADLDFSGMFLRLAYLEAGHAPPSGDLYANVPGLTDPRWRSDVKKVTNAMFFRMGPLARLPKDVGKGHPLPAGFTGPVFRAAVLAAHPMLAEVFETGVGFRLMFTESRVLIAALLKMIDAGIPALPMHDGAMVPYSKREQAAEIMANAAEEVVGLRLPTVLKSFVEKPPA